MIPTAMIMVMNAAFCHGLYFSLCDVCVCLLSAENDENEIEDDMGTLKRIDRSEAI